MTKEQIKQALLNKPIVWFLAGVALASFVVIGGIYLFAGGGIEETTIESLVEPEVTEEVVQEEPTERVSNINKDALVDAVEQWVSSTSGTHSVTVTDSKGKVIIDSNGSRSYFAASLYKLYTAYLGYVRVDNGGLSLNDVLASGKTLGTCLDEMIRESDSPCAEALRAQIGSGIIDNEIATFGIKNTSVTNLATTSSDSAKLLNRIWNGEDLSGESRSALLNSMKNQVYRDALQTGFAHSTVYNKVGFRELDEYHDIAIVKFDNDEVLIVSVLTINVGTKNIASLARAIEEVVL